jgi:cell division protein FtsQ
MQIMKIRYFKLLNIIALISLIILAIYVNYNFNKLQNIVKKSTNEQGFIVQEIHVNELSYITIEEIIDNLDFKNGDDIFAIDVIANQERLAKNFWIESVSLKVIFPDIVEIFIVEKKAEFILYEENEYFIIDVKGNIIKELRGEDITRFSDFIVLSGYNARKHSSSLSEFLKLDKNMYNFVVEVIRISEQRWNIKFINDMIVKLPQKDPKSAWSLFLELNDEMRFLENKIKSIDLRVKDRLFLELDINNPKNLKIIREVG